MVFENKTVKMQLMRFDIKAVFIVNNGISWYSEYVKNRLSKGTPFDKCSSEKERKKR